MKKYALQDQLNSPTIVQSLSDLLRRAPNHSGAREFEVSLEQLKKRRRLHLDSPFFLKNLCWTADISPSPTNCRSYDLKLRHQYATDVFDLRVFYSGYIELFVIIDGCKSIPLTSEIKSGVGTFKKFIDEQIFEKIKEVGAQLKFRVKLHLTQPPITHRSFFGNDCSEYLVEKWNEDGDFRMHWYENNLLSEQEMDLPLHEALAKYLSRLLSEDTIKRCCAEDWAQVLYCFMQAVALSRSPKTYMAFSRAGVFKLIAKFFAADLSQISSLPVIKSLNLLLTDQMHKQPVTSNSVVQSQICEAFDLAFVNIMPKFSDTRYPLEVLSYFSLHFLPHIVCYRHKRLNEETLPRSKLFLSAFENLQYFLPFYNYQSVLSLADMRPETQYSDIDNSCLLFDTFAQFYILQFMASHGRVSIPTPVESMLMETICENLSNPFYPDKERNFSICTLHTIFNGKRATLRNWSLKNSDRKPFLIFPTTMEVGLNMVDMVTTELTDEDGGVRNKLTAGFGPFFKFLGACYNSISASEPFRTIEENTPVEQIKAQANLLHRGGQFNQALEMYSRVIATSETYARRLGKKRNQDQQKIFYYVDLANLCHNNRASSFMETQQQQCALGDVVFVINEIQSLISGDHDLIRGYKPSPSEVYKLKERLVKAKFKRLKLVAALSLWIPALRNSLDLLENYPDTPNETLSYYYQSLLKYSATTFKVQYPPFCIVCHARKGKTGSVHDQIKMKCKKCRHGYCSEECYRKDTTHKTYCAKLVKLRASKAKLSN